MDSGTFPPLLQSETYDKGPKYDVQQAIELVADHLGVLTSGHARVWRRLIGARLLLPQNSKKAGRRDEIRFAPVLKYLRTLILSCIIGSADLDAAQKKNGHRYSWRADNKRATTPMLAPLQGAGGASVLRFNLRTPAGATHEKRGQAQFGKTSSLIPDLRGMASKVCMDLEYICRIGS